MMLRLQENHPIIKEDKKRNRDRSALPELGGVTGLSERSRFPKIMILKITPN